MKKAKISGKDLARLSAYIDGQLSPRERARFEARLRKDPQLETAHQELRRTRDLIRAAPRLRAPRNFTLTPEMTGQRQALGNRLYPAFRLASALASLLFVLVVAGDLLGIGGLTQRTAQEQAVPQIVTVQEEQGVADELPATEELPVEAPLVEAEEEVAETEAPAPETFALEMEVTEAEGEAPVVGEAASDMVRSAPEEGQADAAMAEPLAAEGASEKAAEEMPADPNGPSESEKVTVAADEEVLEKPADEIQEDAEATQIDIEPRIEQEPAAEPLPIPPEPEVRSARWPAIRVVEIVLLLAGISLGLIAVIVRRRGA